MPLKAYSLLKGRPVAVRLGSGENPHYQIKIVDDRDEYRIAVNIRSGDKSFVEYLVRSRFDHPLTERLEAVEPGLHRVPSQPGGLALDYIRANLCQPWELAPLPPDAPGPDNDLNEKIGHYAQRALADENAFVYAYGEPWGPEENVRDKYFGFKPGRGVHDIHMNQGNPPGRFADDNGPWQDGGLIFEFPGQRQWVAVFLKFQTQSWHTDDHTGAALDLGTDGAPADRVPEHMRPHRMPTQDLPDGMVRIVAALVNDTRSPERETVTLLNVSDGAISLDGWAIADRNKNRMPLSGRIGPGETLLIEVKRPAELSNRGGLITLLDARGVKVHGVSYTREQARHPGWTITFPA